ncbi:MAG: hypothetical protein HW387_1153 [Parachlamydiales bacterium]|nr:hypothetical protein [Parachlamydiales bacterium]
MAMITASMVAVAVSGLGAWCAGKSIVQLHMRKNNESVLIESQNLSAHRAKWRLIAIIIGVAVAALSCVAMSAIVPVVAVAAKWVFIIGAGIGGDAASLSMMDLLIPKQRYTNGLCRFAVK